MRSIRHRLGTALVIGLGLFCLLGHMNKAEADDQRAIIVLASAETGTPDVNLPEGEAGTSASPSQTSNERPVQAMPPVWTPRVSRGRPAVREGGASRSAGEKLTVRTLVPRLDETGLTLLAEPSLFFDDRRPALSELYRAGTRNAFSLVDGKGQVIWEVGFRPPEPEYYQSRRLNIRRDPADVPSEHPGHIFGRIRTSFSETPPLSGRGAGSIEVTSVPWTGASAVTRLYINRRGAI